MSKIYILLGVGQDANRAGIQLLKQLLFQYSLYEDMWDMRYCYAGPPPSRAKERLEFLETSRRRIETEWREVGYKTVIGFGWMPCEILTGVGKTKLQTRVGTKWPYVGEGSVRECWITNDPSAALFDPNVTVDIVAVILAACAEAGIPCPIDKDWEKFDWSPYI